MEVESRSWLGLGGGRGGNDMVKFKTRLQGGPSGTLAFVREKMREKVVNGLLRVWLNTSSLGPRPPTLNCPYPVGHLPPLPGYLHQTHCLGVLFVCSTDGAALARATAAISSHALLSDLRMGRHRDRRGQSMNSLDPGLSGHRVRCPLFAP